MPPSELKILIVEDVDMMRSLLEYLISGIPGCKVSGLAKNGWEARLELNRRRPDLVLLDEVLPGESSLDLVRDFKAERIPVLLVTELTEPSLQLPEGTSGRVTKPGWKSLEEDRKRIEKSIFQIVHDLRRTD